MNGSQSRPSATASPANDVTFDCIVSFEITPGKKGAAPQLTLLSSGPGLRAKHYSFCGASAEGSKALLKGGPRSPP